MKTLRLLILALFSFSLTLSAQVGFRISEIDDALFLRMQGKSFGDGCTTLREDLRHLSLLYYDEKGLVQRGELVCHKTIAQDLLDIFRELFRQHYVIARIRLVDDYDGDDQRSMAANNTSCFNFRRVSGTKSLSRHALGMAIDINPLYNPYVRRQNGKTLVEPTGAEPYVNRSQKIHPQMIDRQDLCYRLFTQHGFRWGGAWRSSKDYQHFEK